MSLGNAIKDAVALHKQLQAQGAPNLPAAFEAAVRAVWPFTREWKYLCDDCGDVGLEIVTCEGAGGPCGRSREHLPHEFGRPCWCRKGEAWKPKPKTQDDALAQAAKVSKPSRFGR